MRAAFFALFALLFAAAPALAQDDAGAIHYTTVRDVTLLTAPDSGRAYAQLRFREPVTVLETDGAWSRVRTRDGALGYVESVKLSNVWIRVSKTKRMLYVYRGARLVERMPADFGTNAFADKTQRGSTLNPDDWRTPEGTFFVAKKNPHSTFHKALVLNYPTAEDAERGLHQDLISKAEYAAIVRAEREYGMPPMNTSLGGWIEIHGRGTGVGSNWTQGCVAVADDHIDALYRWATVGTPVVIER